MKFNSYYLLLALLYSMFFEAYFISIHVSFFYITLMKVIILIGVVYVMVQRPIRQWLNFGHPFINKVFFFFIVWYAYGLASIFWAKDPTAATRQMFYFSFYLLLIFVVLHLVKTTKEWYGIVKHMFIIFYLLTAIAVVEMMFAVHLPTSHYYGIPNAHQSTSIFYNENDFSFFYNLMFPFVLFKISQASSKLFNIHTVLAITVFGILYINDARLALLTTVVEILLFVLLKRKVWLKSVKQKWFALVGSLAFLFISTIVLKEKIISIYDQLISGTGSNAVRLNLIRDGLYMLKESHFIGVGAENFEANVHKDLFYTGRIINPHNWWMEILANYGLFIFIGYVVILLIVLVKLWKVYAGQNNVLALVLFIMWIGFIFGCMAPSRLFYFNFIWFLYPITLLLFKMQENSKI